MLRFITIRKAIALLLIGLFLINAAGVTAYLVSERLQSDQKDLIDRSVLLARGGSQQELAIYYRDGEVLEELLQHFLQDSAIQFAAVFGPQGTEITSRFQDNGSVGGIPAFSEFRDDFGPLEIGRAEIDDPVDKGQLLLLSIPVFSFINPLDAAVSRESFGQTLVLARNKGARHVMGYYLLGINLEKLQANLVGYGLTVGAISLLIFLVTVLVVLMITRRITAPLANLAQLADDISAGKLDKTFRAKGTGEVHQIASMLNLVLSELSSHKAKMDVESHLLSMKVNERTQQLSRRNKELNQAVKQVTQAKDKLRQLAYYDSLTSLPNRALFTEQLELLLKISKRDKSIVALLFLDLDNFKRINDSPGHNAGDMLLREVAARLSNCIRESDLISQYFDAESKIGVARLGGDEFTVVLNKVEEPKIAGVVAERLLESLQTPMLIEGHEIVITPSIGIALAPTDASTVEDLLKRADTAMYHAKTTGKNSYRYYSSAMRGTGVGRLKLESDLRRAMEREEMTLYYQPQINIETGEISGAEALIRWKHPKHGLVPPVRFIPLAEEMGLIVELGAWTLIEACNQCKAFQELGLKLPKIAVNVSSLQFNAAFIELVKQVLIETQLEPHLLELELTEGVIMSNAKASVEALHELKALGVSLSVDDFGTGYSSLSYLSLFPLDKLKIDRSFVINYDKNENNASLVSAIIAMGRSMNLRMVAEGVDNEDQFRFLRKQGIQVIQGYLFAEPMPADEFARLLTDAPYLQQIKEIVSR
jgi:diguanylate cyclase (GGDEF)-like protein